MAEWHAVDALANLNARRASRGEDEIRLIHGGLAGSGGWARTDDLRLMKGNEGRGVPL